MAYTVRRYQDKRGNVPFTDWITRLRKKQRQAAVKIDTRIDRAAAGNFGDHKFVRDGVWEMRIDFGTGYRVYYAVEGKAMIILFCGGDKTSQDGDIDKSVSFFLDYQERKGNEKK